MSSQTDWPITLVDGAQTSKYAAFLYVGGVLNVYFGLSQFHSPTW